MSGLAAVVAVRDKENAGYSGKAVFRQTGSTPRRVLSNRSNLTPSRSECVSQATPAVNKNIPQMSTTEVFQTPSAPQSVLRQISWEVHLQQYLQKCAPVSPEQAACLTAAVHESPQLPEAWWSLIQCAESQPDAAVAKPQDKRQGLAMLQLYEWATKQVPRQGNYENSAFLNLWIGYAKQQWLQNGQDEGRDAFKSLKNQQIADKAALLYTQWADLEVKTGNTNRAIKQLRTGVKEAAQPVRQLEEMLNKLQPEGSGVGQASRAGPGDNDPTTSTLQDAMDRLHGQHLSGSGDGVDVGSFMTPAGARCPRGPPNEGQDGLPHNMSTCRIGTGSRPLQAHHAGATETMVINPKAGLQARHVNYATGVHGNNMTYHSTSSGSTISESECTTATLHSHPKMPCANVTSRSISSHGSSVSGEETQTIHDKTVNGGSLGGEGTIQINQSLAHQSRPASSHVQQSFASAFRRDRSVGPKRTGLGGGAARVPMAMRAVPIKPALSTAAEQPATAAAPNMTNMGPTKEVAAQEVAATSDQGEVPLQGGSQGLDRAEAQETDSAQADNSKKRKADGEARQSPEVATAVAGSMGKRRASPEAETRGLRASSGPGNQQAASSRIAGPITAGPPHALPACAHSGAAASGAAGSSADAEEADDEEPETLPLLARRVMAGRQSIAPHYKAADGTPAGQGQPQTNIRPVPTAYAQSAASHASTEEAAGTSKPNPHDASSARTNSHMKPPTRRAPAPPPSLLNKAPLPPASTAVPAAAPPVKAAAAATTAVAVPQAQSADCNAGQQDAASSSGRDTDMAQKGRDSIVAAQGAEGKAVMGPPPAKPRQPLAPLPQPQSDAPQQQQQHHSSSQQSRQAAAAQQPVLHKESQHKPPQQQQKQRQPQQLQQAQQQQQQKRRVREDENSVIVRGNRYTKLECVGRGGSSKVFKVMAPNRKIFALKRIKLQGKDSEASKGFVDEITLLQRLRGKQNIIQLVDAEVIQSEGTIYMVLEYGDIDLARLLAKHEQARREGGGADELDENFIRLYWQQMLQAVQTIHEARIVHSDLKPANFLMVEGQLKLIDFGIAKAISSDTTSIARESQVGTLNYMSPEAILGGTNNIRGAPPMKVGRASDVWSLGCILYQMVYGHTPFSALAFIQKMHAITDPGYRIAFDPIKNAALADTIKRCLDRSPRTRIQMQDLLDHPFLRPTEGPAGPAPGQVGLTRDQLKKLLTQVSEASASGADLDTLSEELFRQLSSGQTVNLGSIFGPAKQDAGHPTGPATLTPQATPAQQHQHLHRAAQAISAAAAAAAVNQGTTPGALLGTAERSGSGQLEGAPATSVSGLLRVASEAPGPARALSRTQAAVQQPSAAGQTHLSEADLEKQAGKLRKVEAHLIGSKASPNVDPLMAALQQGIAKMAVHSIASDNTTGSTATWQASIDK